jgi:hypothetical protein
MKGAWVLLPAFARPIHADLTTVHLASDLSREHVAENKCGARVVMRGCRAARRVVDDDADKAFAGNIGQDLAECPVRPSLVGAMLGPPGGDWTKLGLRKASLQIQSTNISLFLHLSLETRCDRQRCVARVT